MQKNKAKLNEFLFNLSAFLSSAKSTIYFLENEVKKSKKQRTKEWWYCEEKCKIYMDDDLSIILKIRNQDVHKKRIVEKIRKNVTVYLPVAGSSGETTADDIWFFKERQDKPLLELCENFLKTMREISEKLKSFKDSE
jgi:hypothetical protein